MPNRMYTVSRARADMLENRRRQTGHGPKGDHRLAVMFGTGPKVSKRPTKFPVFEYIDHALARKPVGARVTVRTTRSNGKQVDYVYEKAADHYFLVERSHWAKGASEPRVEEVPRPKKFR